ncbi:hypothetical protein DENSPDRAFT_288436 [Dentipellis sp. KUC8613]|nr:hypothetical protein DENSPDRAFT_288436 [Dentipellis sp. KUC8613]
MANLMPAGSSDPGQPGRAKAAKAGTRAGDRGSPPWSSAAAYGALPPAKPLRTARMARRERTRSLLPSMRVRVRAGLPCPRVRSTLDIVGIGVPGCNGGARRRAQGADRDALDYGKMRPSREAYWTVGLHPYVGKSGKHSNTAVLQKTRQSIFNDRRSRSRYLRVFQYRGTAEDDERDTSPTSMEHSHNVD